MGESAPALDKPRKPQAEGKSFGQVVKKRWRAWLRALHRDIGYVAVGFTIIYAISGIAMNHLADWDPSFRSAEYQLSIAPIADSVSDDAAAAQIGRAAGISDAPSTVFRAGDEVRLEYPNGSKVTAIGDTVTVQKRDSRFFFRVAVWLHATRGKAAWKYISDAYAVLLLYLAISGIFMIKGKLGLRWRGTLLILAGLGGPVGYIVLSGGPDAHKTDPALAAQPGTSDGIRYLPAEPAGDTAPERPPVRTPDNSAAPERPPVRTPDSSAAPERPPVRTPPPPDSSSAPERPPVRTAPPP